MRNSAGLLFCFLTLNCMYDMNYPVTFKDHDIMLVVQLFVFIGLRFQCVDAKCRRFLYHFDHSEIQFEGILPLVLLICGFQRWWNCGTKHKNDAANCRSKAEFMRSGLLSGDYD